MPLFHPFRVLGLVGDGSVNKGFLVYSLGTATFLMVSTGKGFQVYNASTLRVVLVGVTDQLADSVSALCTFPTQEVTYTAHKSEIHQWKRSTYNKPLLSVHAHDVRILEAFGKDILLSVDSNGFMVVWDGEEVRHKISLGSEFNPTLLLHPHTYLNKVLVGGAQGVQLWNISTGKLVHSFDAFQGITCAAQSPVVDVVAFGTDQGKVLLHNLKTDSQVVSFSHAEQANVTSVSFSQVSEVMSSSSADGELAIWDLDKRRVKTVLRGPHSGKGIARAAFLPGEPLLMSLGMDNSLKCWIFDQEEGAPRLLRERSGHSVPPSRVRFYPGGETVSTIATGADARVCEVLSAGGPGDGALRVFHTKRENQNRVLSQGHIKETKKSFAGWNGQGGRLPSIVDFVACEAREKDWCNIVSAHQELGAAITWSFDQQAVGTKVLRPDTKGGSNATTQTNLRADAARGRHQVLTTSVSISACGHFALCGDAEGRLHKYNLQSGMYRGSFPRRVVDQDKLEHQKKRRRKAAPGTVRATTGDMEGDNLDEFKRDEFARHSGPVYGVACDSINQYVVSAGYDGVLHVWNFDSHKLVHSLDLGSSITQIVAKDTLVAVACDDFVVYVVDMVTAQIVRRFRNAHQGRITDMCLDAHARWLFTSSMDASVKVWDLPTGRCIDWMLFHSVVLSLSLSPTQEFLVTSHVDDVALYLWANKVLFGGAVADKTCMKGTYMELPSTSVDTFVREEEKEEEVDEKEEGEGESVDTTAKDELTHNRPGCVALSGPQESNSKWFVLAHLDQIKERNKPIEAPKKPASAPFFLPSQNSLLSKADPFASSNWGDDEEEKGVKEGDKDTSLPVQSRIMQSTGFMHPTSAFIQAIQSGQALEKKLKPMNKSKKKAAEEAPSGIIAVMHPMTSLDQAQDFERRKECYSPLVSLIQDMTPSGIDFELHSLCLGVEDEQGVVLVGQVLDWLYVELGAGTNFELVQAVLNRVLLIFGESVIRENAGLKDKLAQVQEMHEVNWTRIRGLIRQNLCLVEFFNGIA